MKRSDAYVFGAVLLTTVSAVGADPLNLAEDVTLEVPAGETKTYCTLSGGAYTLTKTGGGTLVFETVSNSSARIIVNEGALDVRTSVLPKPSVLTNAWAHFDATDASTFTASASGGITKITQWRDVNGGSIALNAYLESQNPSWRTNGENRHPFITESFRNGRNVVDLGAVMNVKTAEAGAGHGAAFMFSSACSTMREAFLVVGDTDDSKRSYVDYGSVPGYTAPRCMPFFGTLNIGTSAAPFIRGNISTYNGLKNSTLVFSETTLGYSKCDWTLNGTDVDNELTEILPDGLNLVEIRADADSGILFNTLGTERNYYLGGLRYGEIAIFEEPLSEEDRSAVRAYLSARWLPIDIAYLELGENASLLVAENATLRPAVFKAAGSASVEGGKLLIQSVDYQGTGNLAFTDGECILLGDGGNRYPDMDFPSGGVIDSLSGCAVAGCVTVSGSLVKRGSGAITVPDINDGISVSVEAGKMTVDPIVVGEESWMHLDAGMTNSASMSFSTDNGTNIVTCWTDLRYSAERYAFMYNVSYAPFFRENFQNGLPVLDFGGYSIDGNTQNARGGFMSWKTACTGIREFFTVASDTDDLDWNYDNIEASRGNYHVQHVRGAPFVGNSNTSYPHFLRSPRKEDASNRPGILLSTAAPYEYASVLLDGTNVAVDAEYPPGFHVLNMSMSEGVYNGDSFARDRQQTAGGMMIGEFMVFTNNVTEKRRMVLVKGLMSKWLGGGNTLVRTNADVAVSSGAAYELPYQALVATGSVSIAGTFNAKSLKITDSAIFGSSADFTGDIELADGASFTFPSDIFNTDAEPLEVGRLILSGGTVMVSFASGFSRPALYTPVKILSCSSVEGTAVFRLNVSMDKLCAKFTLNADGLYVEFLPVGTMLIIR